MKKKSLFLFWTNSVSLYSNHLPSSVLSAEFMSTDTDGLQHASKYRPKQQPGRYNLPCGRDLSGKFLNSIRPDAKSLVIKAEAGLPAQNVILDGGNSGTVLQIGGSAGGGTVSLERSDNPEWVRNGIHVYFN